MFLLNSAKSNVGDIYPPEIVDVFQMKVGGDTI